MILKCYVKVMCFYLYIREKENGYTIENTEIHNRTQTKTAYIQHKTHSLVNK